MKGKANAKAATTTDNPARRTATARIHPDAPGAVMGRVAREPNQVKMVRTTMGTATAAAYATSILEGLSIPMTDPLPKSRSRNKITRFGEAV